MHIIQAALTQVLIGNYDPSFLTCHSLTTSGEHLGVKLIQLLQKPVAPSLVWLEVFFDPW